MWAVSSTMCAHDCTLESKLVDVHLTGAREDSIRNPIQLYGRLVKLYDSVDGRVGSGGDAADLGPTSQQLAVNGVFKKQLAEGQAAYRELMNTNTEAFNALLKQNGLDLRIQP